MNFKDGIWTFLIISARHVLRFLDLITQVYGNFLNSKLKKLFCFVSVCFCFCFVLFCFCFVFVLLCFVCLFVCLIFVLFFVFVLFCFVFFSLLHITVCLL